MANDDEKESLKAQIEQMTPEEKQELMKTYHKISSSGVELKIRRGPTDEVLHLFHLKLLELFRDDAPYLLVTYWHIEDVYDAIQVSIDPHATFMSRRDMREYMRLWLPKNANRWQERNERFRNAMRCILPNGYDIGPVQGYGRKGKYWLDADKDACPHDALYTGQPAWRSERRSKIKDEPEANTAA